MMFLLGKGGEGKSRIGLVLKKLMGDAVSNGSIQKVETSRFARADLENRLLMVDDDLNMNALPKTNYIKSIMTAEAKMDVERKGMPLARNDGIDRTSVRNLAVSDKAVGNTQQHNEREKDSYRNFPPSNM